MAQMLAKLDFWLSNVSMIWQSQTAGWPGLTAEDDTCVKLSRESPPGCTTADHLGQDPVGF